MRKSRGFSLILLAGLLAACSGDASQAPSGGDAPWRRPGGGGRGSSASELEEISVKAARVERDSIFKYLLSNTTLEPIRAVTIVARLGALVTEIRVEEGDRVARGQLLAKLDDREIRNEYQQAKIAVDQAEIRMRQAKVQAEQSQSNFERSRRLREQKLISQQDYDQTALTARTDALAYEVAQEEYEAAKARLNAVELQVEYTTIESSIEGVVTERMIEVGDRVTANQEAFRVEDFTPMWARIFIPEKELGRVRMGQRAQIDIEAFPGRAFHGRVNMINPRVDPESGTVKVTLEVSGSQGLLRPGLFGVVKIPAETRENALVIPKKAVLRERDENRVFVIKEDGTVEKRTVEIGISQEERVEIVQGLSEGEAVVTVGQESLNDGYPVKVLSWESGGGGEIVSRPAPAGERPAGLAGSRARERPEGAPARGRMGMGQGDPQARFQAFLERFPEVKKEYEKRVEEDPELKTDAQKRRAFVREMLAKLRGRQ